MKKDNNGTLYLGIDDILDVIGGLSRSQGFYGRLLNDLLEVKENDDEQWQNIVEQLEAKKFRTSLDVVFFFEC